MIRTLASISAEPNRLIRTFLTPEHRAAADLVGKWMRAGGLDVSEDALGTVRGSLGGRGQEEASDRLAYRHRGRVRHVRRAAWRRRRHSRRRTFRRAPSANCRSASTCWLSATRRACAFRRRCRRRWPWPAISMSRVCSMIDREGVTLREAITAYGKKVADIPAAAYTPEVAAAYVEVHIEQGPVLEYRNQPLGVVTSIAGQTYLNVELLGEAGHAGTVPMMLRRDALAGGGRSDAAGRKNGARHQRRGGGDRRPCARSGGGVQCHCRQRRAGHRYPFRLERGAPSICRYDQDAKFARSPSAAISAC